MSKIKRSKSIKCVEYLSKSTFQVILLWLCFTWCVTPLHRQRRAAASDLCGRGNWTGAVPVSIRGKTRTLVLKQGSGPPRTSSRSWSTVWVWSVTDSSTTRCCSRPSSVVFPHPKTLWGLKVGTEQRDRFTVSAAALILTVEPLTVQIRLTNMGSLWYNVLCAGLCLWRPGAEAAPVGGSESTSAEGDNDGRRKSGGQWNIWPDVGQEKH